MTQEILDRAKELSSEIHFLKAIQRAAQEKRKNGKCLIICENIFPQHSEAEFFKFLALRIRQVTRELKEL
jgi:hypothetical protein